MVYRLYIILLNNYALIMCLFIAPVLHIISAIPYYSYPGGDLISVQSSFIESVSFPSY